MTSLATVSEPRHEDPEDDEAQRLLDAWDAEWAAAYHRMVTNSRSDGILPRKTVALIVVALNASCTARDVDGTRRAIRAALAAGATRDELLTVLKMAALVAIHSCSLGAPLILAEVEAHGGAVGKDGEPSATPACNAMKAMGQWNTAWDPFFDLDPVWTDQFMAAGLSIYADGVLTTKEVELLSIAFDASVRHMYAPGTARHIRGALAAGATPQEIMAVLKLCVAFGGEALTIGVPILAEELERGGAA